MSNRTDRFAFDEKPPNSELILTEGKSGKINGVIDDVIFLKSISNELRSLLLKTADILLYTPENEHFGIVPVEAMYCGTIVIACNSGGPTESIIHL